MSMREYSVDDYGLVLNEEDIELIASKCLNDSNDEVFNLAYELYEKGILEYISEFSGEAQALYENGLYSFYGEYYGGDYIYYIPVRTYPTLFRAAYNDMEELIEEFKERIGKYLPNDFDYRSRIRHIVGTYYG